MLNFFVFSMRFVSFLHSCFTSYHSQSLQTGSFLVPSLQHILSKKLKISWTILDNCVHCKNRKLLSNISQEEWFNIFESFKQIWIQHVHSYYLTKNQKQIFFSKTFALLKKMAKIWTHCSFIKQNKKVEFVLLYTW